MSTLLQVENLSRSYGDKILFENITFSISRYQKIALVARNGIGKTSLLNIIAGLEPSDGGTAKLLGDTTLAYLPQEPLLTASNTVFHEVYSSQNPVQKAILEYEEAIRGSDRNMLQHCMAQMDALNAWEYETRIRQILTRLDLPSMDQKVSELSGGQRKRLALARTLITEPDLLILDEPTNHLDIEMIEWLEEYLSRASVSLLMVTHDRYFLENVCDEILELDNGSLFRYKGNYSYFLEKQQERKDNLNRETEKARNLMRTEQEWMRRMPKARGTKAKARVDSFYELKEKADTRTHDQEMKLTMEGARMGKKILEMHDVSFSYDDLDILKGFTYIFKRNEKTGVIGRNGSGKSTFLDIVTGSLRQQKGRVETGGTIEFGHYRQEGITFNENTRVIDVVKEIADVVKMSNGDTLSAAAFLNYFMFPYPMHQQYVYKLSGGERRRLYLVTVLMRNPNFLILDEPTNDLDILTLNVLEEYLANFKGCVIVVTHDRFFLDKIVDHLFVFEGDGRIRDFPGNYTQYSEWAARQKKKTALEPAAVPVRERPKTPNVRKLTYKEKMELESLEKKVRDLEQEKISLEEALSSGTLAQEELSLRSERYGQLLKELEAAGDRWLELSEKAEGET